MIPSQHIGITVDCQDDDHPEHAVQGVGVSHAQHVARLLKLSRLHFPAKVGSDRDLPVDPCHRQEHQRSAARECHPAYHPHHLLDIHPFARRDESDDPHRLIPLVDPVRHEHDSAEQQHAQPFSRRVLRQCDLDAKQQKRQAEELAFQRIGVGALVDDHDQDLDHQTEPEACLADRLGSNMAHFSMSIRLFVVSVVDFRITRLHQPGSLIVRRVIRQVDLEIRVILAVYGF